MPEVANVPLPTKLLRHGVRDMVRVCDGRMSGTVVLHVAPEAAAGGPLAKVCTGVVVLAPPGLVVEVVVLEGRRCLRRRVHYRHRRGGGWRSPGQVY
jgi:dihydroxy-acid dehydratase